MKKKLSSNTLLKSKGSDLARLASMKARDIDLSDSPEVTPEEFAKGVVRNGLTPPIKKTQITLRIDSDVLEWFRAKGKGYQGEMNALLKAYVEAHRNVRR